MSNDTAGDWSPLWRLCKTRVEDFLWFFPRELFYLLPLQRSLGLGWAKLSRLILHPLYL